MPLSHVIKRLLHTTPIKYRGAVSNPGWYPRDHMPGNYPKNEEERRAAAIKYGLRPEDYTPYDPDDPINFMGDYPDVGIVTYEHKDPYEAYTDKLYRRNWCEPVTRQHQRYNFQRWSYTGLNEEDYDGMKFIANASRFFVPIGLILLIFGYSSEEIRKVMAYIDPKIKMPVMPKHYPLDFYRAFPFEDPTKYPLLNYSFEPADELDPEGDNAKFPFNESVR